MPALPDRRIRIPSRSLRTRLALWTFGLLLAWAVLLAAVIQYSAITLTIGALTVRQCVTSPDTGSMKCKVPPPVYKVTRQRLTVSDTLDTLRHMGALSLGGLAATLLLGGVATYWVAGRALRPVREMGRVARSIDIDRLDSRLTTDGANDELRDLAVAFDAMLDRLREGIARERRFVADASHELRTPLAILRTNVEVLRKDPDATVAKYREMTGALERSARRLEALVDDLLILATEDRLPRRASVSLTGLLESVVGEMRTLAGERGVRLELLPGADAAVEADEPLLRRAITNVIENGVRYNRPGGYVRVSVDRADGLGLVEVTDSGLGIPRHQIPSVFERFWRADRSRSRAKGGAGLGLAITAEILERHGGGISVDSKPGTGTTFRLRIPLADSAEMG